MPCSDSSSSIVFKIDHDERFIEFDFAKITCGREITGETGYSTICVGKNLHNILNESFEDTIIDLKLKEEEEQFILFLEWAALRSAIAQYLGEEDDSFDADRCSISSIETGDKEIEVALVILPPE